MLKLIELQKDVENWVYDFVSVYNEQLEAIPCPFAKHAMVNNRIIWKVATTLSELENICNNYTDQDLWEMKEILIVGINPEHISFAELEEETDRLNREVLIDAGLIALEDHPNKPEMVSGVTMNQGKWALVLIQSKEKLTKASQILEKQGYYSKWTKEQLDEVVNWR